MTAVIVAHDGAAWLPQVIDSLLEQTRPVQRVVAVDTGSRDRSGAVLAGKLGQAVVFGMDRGTGYGAAVTKALQHKAANANVPGSAALPRSERAEWVWLLHDDCEPAPDALEQLLRGAAETRAAAVLGPKVKDWADHDVILEAGVTIDTVGRRITGVEIREVDQGQHDGDRDALAVSSAGMLIRRDVWDEISGFDTSMALFMEDVDFCWRAHAAGYRVRVITDAVVYHAQAAARNGRPISVGRRPRLLDRRNSMLTLLGNLPAWPMLASLAGNVTVSVLRTLFFLLAKRPTAALDELAAVASVLGHPIRLLRARHRRSRGRRAAYGRLRADLPRGRSARRMAEFAAAAMSRSAQLDTTGSHHATDDPSDDDFLLTDTGLAQRILTSPGVLLFAGLTVVALVAERSLIGAGPLGGGGLVPAWGGASGLWGEYLQGFHPAGIGSGSSVPPYLAILAALATLLGGKLWLAVDVILLGCVPLAGICAFLAARRVTRLVSVRVWAAATYALLPVALGTVAAGRIGTAAAFVLLPLIALMAGRMFTEPPRRARRAAWATGLLVAIAAAFVPLLWVVAVIAAVVAAIACRKARPTMPRNLGIVVLVPPVLLLPWTLQVAAHPSLLLLEAGLQQAGVAQLPARSLMLLSPGGPGLPPVWVTAGLVVTALAALLVSTRRVLVMAGWGIALSGLLVAIAVSRMAVTPADGPTINPWTGPALAIVAAGLLLAACAAGDALARLAAGRGRGLRGLASPRRAWVALLALVACSAPLLAAAFWVTTGIKGPVAPASGQTVPELVSVSADGRQLRTLVLRAAGGQVSYSLLRGSSPALTDPDLAPAPAAQQALNAAVATLVAPGGGDAVNQRQSLARFDIGFVLMLAPVNQGLARLLDGVAGMRPVSTTAAFALWRLDSMPARVRVVAPDGTVMPVRSGEVNVSGAAAPAQGGILELAEPAGGWHATLNGHALTAVPSPAGSWAQAFRLPPGGGTLDISRAEFGHDAVLVLAALALAVVAALALPGVRTAAEQDPVVIPAGRDARDRAAADGEEDGSQGTEAARGGSRSRPGRSSRRSGKDSPDPSRPRRKRRAGAPQRAGAAAGRAAAAAAAGQAGASTSGPPVAWPYADEPAARQPPAGPWPHADDPAAQEPYADEPLVSGPYADEPHVSGPYASGLYADEPYADEPRVSGPYADEPHVSGPHVAGPYVAEPYLRESAGVPASRHSAAGAWPDAEEPYAGQRYAGEPAGVPLPRQSPTGTWPQPAEPYAAEPAGWPSADQDSGWQTAGQQQGWQSSDQESGWQTAGQQQGWPPAEDDVLEPLPSPGETDPGWHQPGTDEMSARRWPAPDQEPEGEGW